jgi:type I restriction enzyme R subunit
VLYYHNLPLAIVEAKDNNHALGGGMQQALEYAEMWDVSFCYSSKGDGFLEHDCLATGKLSTSIRVESVS